MALRAPAVGPRLNWQVILPVVSAAVLAAGLGMVVCGVVAAVNAEGGVVAFAVSAAVALGLSIVGLAGGRRLRNRPFRARDGFVAVSLAWIVTAAIGAVPFLAADAFDRPVDAFFESMSGFTTTGATLLDRIEPQPDALLLWRSLTQWIGGVGIVVLVVAIAPATGLATQRVFFAETSGVTAERLTPRIADTAKIVWGIYVGLTGAAFAAYWVAGMTPWDAVNHAFTTLATGGFSTRTASIAAFDSVPIELIAIVFMAAGGVNFALYWRALRGERNLWPQLAELRAYLLILLAATAAIATSVALSDEAIGLADTVRASAFTVTSLMTTTGYTTADFDTFPDFARLGVLFLMFVGGCAGSTSGGMKVIRVMLLGKTAGQEVQRQLQPQAVQVLRVRGRVYSEEVRRGVLGFFYVYITVFVAGSLVMAAIGLDFVTAVASVVATLNIIGPSIGDVGAAENYSAVPGGGLWLLSALMLIGRLEVFTVLVLLTPAFWRRSIA